MFEDFDFEKYKEGFRGFIEKNKRWLKLLNALLIRYFRWFTVLVVIFMLIVGSSALLWPKYREVESLVESSKQQQEDVFSQKQEKLEDLESVIRAYENISDSKEEKIKTVIPERRNEEEIFSEIKNLVESNNLVLKQISREGEEEEDEREREEERAVVSIEEDQEEKEEEKYQRRSLPSGVKRTRVNMFVLGTNYNSFRSLLKTLEHNLTLMDIVNVNFNPEAKTTNLVLDTYQIR